MEIIKAIILGIIQGITEWLPVSSTGHMILANEFIHLLGGQNKDFVDLFLVVIQFGSILAVVTLYFNRLNPFSPKKTAQEKKATWSMWFKVLVAEIPAAVVGLLFDDYIDEKLYNWFTVALMLLLYGIAFIIVEKRKKEATILTIDDITYKTALLMGVFQMLALVPGTSRSGATILGAVILGTSRAVAAEFSFFLAVPVMFGASLLKIAKYGFVMNGEELGLLLVGMTTAYIVSVFSIKFLVEFVKKHDFTPFGWYRIILAVVIFAYFLSR
ncbi:MAG: undecaprenyl-diphosphate phosphatase [Clostridia bacterium]|nr:undecaprenyl-diphosphate phosphatase [Clostridia bacterium]